jgi:hypothetical protein
LSEERYVLKKGMGEVKQRGGRRSEKENILLNLSIMFKSLPRCV